MTIPQKLLIAVEGKTDATILRAILGKHLESKTRFFSGEGKVGLVTVGRNLLVHEGGPVLLVMNSDTVSPEQSEEEEALAAYALATVTSDANSGVFMFKPSIEVIFFEAPEVLARLLGIPISGEIARDGAFIPKRTLDNLLSQCGTDYHSFVSSLDADAATKLAKGEQASKLIEKMTSMMTLTSTS